MSRQATFFAPGKLFIAGEYAVTAKDGIAVISPIKKGIRVQVFARKKYRIINRQYPQESMKFAQIGELPNRYIRLAMEVVRQWLVPKKIKWSPFLMTIDSTLEAKHGKYGLGSSGALIVAVIGALLNFFRVEYTAEQLYKLSVIATMHQSQDTSFGDVACSSMRRLIHYRKFNESFLHILSTLHVHNAMKLEWKGLILKPLPPIRVKPLVVFSGTSAQSNQLVKKMRPWIQSSWIQQSNDLVKSWIKDQDVSIIHQLHHHLLALSKTSGIKLVTEGIETILTLAKTYGGVGKFSGAGGGDSVLVFIPPAQKKAFLTRIKKEKYRVLSNII